MNLKIMRIFSLMFPLLPSLLFASEAINSKKQKDVVEDKFKKTIVLESMKNRTQEKYNINYAIGLAVEGGAIHTGEVSYHLDERRSLSVSFSSLQRLYSNSRALEGNGDLTSINYKRFFGNSFYLKSGLYYKNLKTKIDLDDFYESKDRTERLQAIGLDFRIGNQWQWDYFTIGVDWIAQNIDFYNISINQGQRKETNSFFTAFNVYLGVVF